MARPSWAHAPGETRRIKATIGKRIVAALRSARLLRDGTICAFYSPAGLYGLLRRTPQRGPEPRCLHRELALDKPNREIRRADSNR